MSSSDGSVTIEVTLTKDQLEKGLKSVKDDLNSLGKVSSVNKAIDGISNSLRSVGSIATKTGKACSVVTGVVAGVFTAAGKKAKDFIGVYENARAIFEKKLGKTGADQMYDQLLKIAKGSRYAQEYIVQAGQTLVAMGINANDTAKYVQIATNAMSGMGKSGAEVQAMAELFGKMSMQTTLYTEDLNQLLTAGIPVFDILSEKYGTTTDAIKDMASHGELTAKDFQYLTDVLQGNVAGMEKYSVAGLAAAGKTGTLTGALDGLNSSFRSFALNLLDLDPRTESGSKNVEKITKTVQAFGSVLETIGTKFSFVGTWISDFLDKLVTVETTVDESGNQITVLGGYLGDLQKKIEALSPEQCESIAKALLTMAAAGPGLLLVGKALNTIADAISGLGIAVKAVTKVVSVFGKLVEVFQLVSGGAGTLSEAMSAVFGTVGSTLTGITGIVSGSIMAVKNFLDMLKNGFSWLKEALMVIGIAIAAVGAIILGVPALIAGIVAAIVAAVGTLVVVIKQHWEEISSFFTETIPSLFQSFIGKIQEFGQLIIDGIIAVWNNIVGFFTETIPGVVEAFLGKIQEFGENIKNLFVTAWNNIVSFFTESIPAFIQSIINWIQDLPYKIGFLLGEIIGNIINFGAEIWNWITTELPKIIDGIVNWFAQLPGRIWTWLVNVVTNIANWGQQTWNTAVTWATKTITSIIDWFKQLPGRIWTWLVNTISRISNWGQQTWSTAVSWASKTIAGIVDWFRQLPGKIWTWLQNVITNVGRWGIDMANKGKEGAKNLFGNVVNTIKGLPQEMLNIGKNIVQGLWNGIQNAKDWMVGKVKEFAKGILDGMKNALGIHSPSRVFRDQVGKYIALGVQEGFTDNISNVYKKMKNAVDVENAKLSTSLTANQVIKVEKEDKQQVTLQSIDDNKEHTTNVTVKLDGKVLTRVVNKENQNRKLQYG